MDLLLAWVEGLQTELDLAYAGKASEDVLKDLKTRVKQARQELNAGQDRLDQLRRDLAALPEGPDTAERADDLAGSVSRLERRQRSARLELYRWQLVQTGVRRFLPADRFQALKNSSVIVTEGVTGL